MGILDDIPNPANPDIDPKDIDPRPPITSEMPIGPAGEVAKARADAKGRKKSGLVIVLLLWGAYEWSRRR